MALEKNAALTEDMRQAEADINAKYNRQAEQTEKSFRYTQRLAAFDAEQKLAEAEFNLTQHSEEEKTALSCRPRPTGRRSSCSSPRRA
jgi:hypothetical protein